jgi:hypothetical protein
MDFDADGMTVDPDQRGRRDRCQHARPSKQTLDLM